MAVVVGDGENNEGRVLHGSLNQLSKNGYDSTYEMVELTDSSTVGRDTLTFRDNFRYAAPRFILQHARVQLVAASMH
jgi:hypothetical protein